MISSFSSYTSLIFLSKNCAKISTRSDLFQSWEHLQLVLNRSSKALIFFFLIGSIKGLIIRHLQLLVIKEFLHLDHPSALHSVKLKKKLQRPSFKLTPIRSQSPLSSYTRWKSLALLGLIILAGYIMHTRPRSNIIGRRLSFANNGQPDQLENAMEQDDMEVRPQTQNVGSSSEFESQASGSNTTKNIRGVTVAAKIWARTEPYGDLQFNEYGQVINERAKDFSTFIGTLSRKYDIIPLHVPDWRYVNIRRKEKIFKLCQERFGFDSSYKKYVLGKVADCWRKSKSRMKAKAFKAGSSVSQQAIVRPQSMPEAHWTTLCHYWQTPEAQAMSEIKKKNRGCNNMPHTGGSETTARWREEMRAQDGTPPSREDLFCTLRIKRGTKNPVSDEARNAIEKIRGLQQSQPPNLDNRVAHRDDILAQVLGPDSRGCVRAVGGGVTPTMVFGHHLGSNTSIASHVAEAQVAKEEAQRLREAHNAQQEEIASLKQKSDDQEKEMAEMRIMLKRLHLRMPQLMSEDPLQDA